MKGQNTETRFSAGDFKEDQGEKRFSESEYEIVFSPEHVLSQLWAIWSDQDGLGRSLRLSLLPQRAGQPPVCLKEPARERERAQALLTHIAGVRIKQMAACSSVDEMAVVFPSEDEMTAWLFLFPPYGEGKPLSAAQIHETLLRQGVIYGIDWNVICGMSNCDHRYFHLFPIAFGKAPVPGRDGQILDRYARVLEKAVQVDELGQANYETLHLVREIKMGDIICEIIPPTAGMPGRTVTGKGIPAPRGREAEVPQGRNTSLSDDGRYLMAERDGHLCFSGRSFQVRPVLHLYEDGEVKKRTIKFFGDVHIHGDICGGISICAIGNIQIDGVIEACNVEAGENIIVSSGVQGQGRAVLHAQKSIYAKYLENCSVYALESVQADCIINCEVYSNGDVRVRTGRGAIIGGTIRAAREVSATTVGSKAERTTLVMLGGKPCEEAERVQILEQIQGTEKELAQLEKLDKNSADEGKKSKLRLNQCVAKLKLEKINKDLEAVAQAYIACDQRRLCCDIAYPGTTVSMDHQFYRIIKEECSCVIRFTNGFLGR